MVNVNFDCIFFGNNAVEYGEKDMVAEVTLIWSEIFYLLSIHFLDPVKTLWFSKILFPCLCNADNDNIIVKIGVKC